MKYLIPFLALILLACEPSSDQEAEALMDSLSTVIDQSRSSLDSVEINKIKSIGDSIDYDRDLVGLVEIDTLPRENAIALGQYLDMNRSVGKFLQTFEDVKGEIEYSQIQVKNLKNDLRSDRVPDSMKVIYIKTEQEAVGRLRESSKNIREWESILFEQFENYRPKAQAVIQNLEPSLQVEDE